jgi:hypothetical protein
VDPNTNIIYDTDNPEYAGFLTKQSMWLKVRRHHTVVPFRCATAERDASLGADLICQQIPSPGINDGSLFTDFSVLPL